MTDDFVRSALPRYGRVPRELLRDPAISDRAVRLYGLLDDYAGVDGRAFPKRATLAACLRDCSVDSVDRAIRELIAYGWLHRQPQHREDGGNTSNLYTLTAGPTPAAPVRPPGRNGAATPAAPVRPQEGEPREGTTPQPPKGGRRDRREARDGDPAWEAFWMSYPRKTGKGQARRAFPAALDKVDGDVTVLVSAALAYARTISELKFAAHPGTWLTGERWLDDLAGIRGTIEGGHTPDPNRRVNWRKGMPECPHHSGYHLDGCVACASEAKAGDR